jgi:hypothetical protein
LWTHLPAPSSRRGQLGHVELTALEVRITPGDSEEIRPVGNRARKAYDHFLIGEPDDLHLLGLAEDRRRDFLAEVDPLQRHGFFADIDERREHGQRLPAIDVEPEIEIVIVLLALILVLVTVSGPRMHGDRGHHDHRSGGELAAYLLHDSLLPVSTGGAIAGPASSASVTF